MVRKEINDMRSRYKNINGVDLLFDIISNAFLIIGMLIVVIPLVNIISQSFSDPASVLAGKVILLPVKPTLVGYSKIISSNVILSGFLNSIIITVVGTLLSVSLTIMAAYPLARKNLYGRGVILWLFTFTMIFNGGLIPTYLLVQSLGLIDSRLALILPNAVAAWNVIISRTFFLNTIPDELYEAATIDGSSDLKTFFRIVLPISKPIVAVMTLFYAVGIWNAYFDALIYLQTQYKYPLQLVLRNILISSQLQAQMMASQATDQSAQLALSEVLKYAVIIFSSLPLMILYPFIQKYFVKGIMIGAVKG